VILYRTLTEQRIDRGRFGTFVKELAVTRGRVPLSIVRKRAVKHEFTTVAPVLLVHGFGQNRYAWHLPSRSFVNYLADAGFDVFNVDLRGHGRSRHFGGPRAGHVDDYVTYDLPIAVDEVRKLSGERRVFLLGHSLGGLVSYAAAPSIADQLAGIVSIGSPYHFTKGSFSLGAIAFLFRMLEWGRVPAINAPLILRPVGEVMRQIRPLAESKLYPLPLRGWHKGALEPEVLNEHLRMAVDRAGLSEMRNMFSWATKKRFVGQHEDHAARFEALDLPLLVVAGLNDDLAPPASVEPAYQRSASTDKTYRTFPFGHIDLLVGRDAPATLWHEVQRWLWERRARAGTLKSA
jgi:pimeloyl-ACP methyl ester carboxylesterase